ncbi:MAG: HAD hydrolase family protein [Burkholderiales bacterium]|nr:HAD hydrolase family protein [Burkholderiales bacterium]
MIAKNSIIIDKAQKIKLVVSDVDGVLTKGELFFNELGEEPFGKFNIYDGFAFIIAHECGLQTAIISGRHSLCTEKRMRGIGTDEIHTGILNKKAKLQEIITRLNLAYDEVAFIGDDLIDLPAMQLVGFSIAPKNAVKEVLDRVDYISKYEGGTGVLREIIELILNAQGKYVEYVNKFLE